MELGAVFAAGMVLGIFLGYQIQFWSWPRLPLPDGCYLIVGKFSFKKCAYVIVQPGRIIKGGYMGWSGKPITRKDVEGDWANFRVGDKVQKQGERLSLFVGPEVDMKV